MEVSAKWIHLNFHLLLDVKVKYQGSLENIVCVVNMFCDVTFWITASKTILSLLVIV